MCCAPIPRTFSSSDASRRVAGCWRNPYEGKGHKRGMNAKKRTSDAGSETALKEALDACRASFMSAAFFSLFVNLLMLLPAIYMLQVYDRVLTSGSESTLLMLTLIVVFLFMVLGGL